MAMARRYSVSAAAYAPVSPWRSASSVSARAVSDCNGTLELSGGLFARTGASVDPAQVTVKHRAEMVVRANGLVHQQQQLPVQPRRLLGIAHVGIEAREAIPSQRGNGRASGTGRG